jgi:hypothetical protein
MPTDTPPFQPDAPRSYEQVPQAPAAPTPALRTAERFDPNAPVVYLEADQATKNIYGDNVRIHPVTKMPLEQGSGALPDHLQIQNHLTTIERDQGLKVADDMRNKLGIKTSSDLSAAQNVVDEAHAKIEKDRFNAAVDAKVKDILTKPPTISPVSVQGSADWSSSQIYTLDQVVTGTDGQNYVATGLGGNLDKNPVLDGNRSYWTQRVMAPRQGAASMTAAEVDERLGPLSGQRPVPQQ